jgi:hypothetical protein
MTDHGCDPQMVAILRQMGKPLGTIDCVRIEHAYIDGPIVRNAIEYLIKMAPVTGADPKDWSPLEVLAVAMLKNMYDKIQP